MCGCAPMCAGVNVCGMRVRACMRACVRAHKHALDLRVICAQVLNFAKAFFMSGAFFMLMAPSHSARSNKTSQSNDGLRAYRRDRSPPSAALVGVLRSACSGRRAPRACAHGPVVTL